MKALFLILQWFCVLAFIIIVLAFTNSKHNVQFSQLEEISIDKNKFLNKDILLKFISGHNIYLNDIDLREVNLDYIESVVEMHPFVRDSDVFSDQQGKLSIRVKEKVPCVRIITDTENYYLDKNMEIMPTSSYYTENVLVVTGDVKSKNHQSIFEFINILRDDVFWNSQITQIHFENNEAILIPRIGDQKIYFGSLDSIDDKLTNLYEFYTQVMPLKGWQAYSNINLKYNNQIVCKKK